MRMEWIGGDERMLRLASLFELDGHDVRTLGLREGDEQSCASERADVVVLPYPNAARLGLVPCLTGLTLHASDALERVKDDALLIAGDGLEPYLAERRERGWRIRRFAEDEALLRVNAELSAEGALAHAMRHPDLALWRLRALVIGYGRLGRALARKLTAFGASVTVAARREEARLRARSDGMRACAIDELPAIVGDIRLALNTVPARVLNDDALRAFPKDALLLELASAPYGFELQAAIAVGLQVEILPAIPGRYAPSAAADALYDSMRRLMKGAFQ